MQALKVVFMALACSDYAHMQLSHLHGASCPLVLWVLTSSPPCPHLPRREYAEAGKLWEEHPKLLGRSRGFYRGGSGYHVQ